MERYQKQVKEFMLAAEQEVRDKPGLPKDDELVLGTRLIMEEALEYVEAAGIEIQIEIDGKLIKLDKSVKLHFTKTKEADIVGLADAVADLNYISYGRACSLGIDMEPIEIEIHKNNMSKFDGAWKDEHGKLRKGPNYKPVDLLPIILKQS